MASLKSAMKGVQRTHRERGQVSGRKHLGNLEKHKDYVLRAKDFHRKRKTIKHLKKKASEKNPDEFYFQMIKSKTKDGVHKKQQETKNYTNEQIQLMKTQDLNYLHLKESAEAKKIEKMKASLHFTELSDKQERNHVFFVDSKREERDFDVAKQLNTLPELVHRSHNIPTLENLHKIDFKAGEKGKLRKHKAKMYTKLEKRIERKTQLEQTREALVLQRHLMGNGTVSKKKFKGGKTYQWKKARKS